MTSNSVSAVILLSQKGTPIAVLPGDLDEVGLDDLLAEKVNAKAPLLVFPHHGGKAGGGTSNSFIQKLCAAVSPGIVVFSVGRGRPQHPLPAVVQTLRQQIRAVRIVCTQLTEHCANKLPTADPTHLASVFAKGREGRRCCGGSVLIKLDGTPALFPDLALHQAFIKTDAPTALCR